MLSASPTVLRRALTTTALPISTICGLGRGLGLANILTDDAGRMLCGGQADLGADAFTAELEAIMAAETV